MPLEIFATVNMSKLGYEIAQMDKTNTLKRMFDAVNIKQTSGSAVKKKESSNSSKNSEYGDHLPEEESEQKIKEETKQQIIAQAKDHDIIFDIEKLDYICLVMKLGSFDMSKYLNGVTEEKDIIILLYNSIKALNFLHSANIIHRDIKPSNILVDKYSRIMICDFGLARTLPRLNEQEKAVK